MKKLKCAFGLKNVKYWTEQYKTEQHNIKKEYHRTNFYGIEYFFVLYDF